MLTADSKSFTLLYRSRYTPVTLWSVEQITSGCEKRPLRKQYVPKPKMNNRHLGQRLALPSMLVTYVRRRIRFVLFFSFCCRVTRCGERKPQTTSGMAPCWKKAQTKSMSLPGHSIDVSHDPQIISIPGYILRDVTCGCCNWLILGLLNSIK